MRDYFHLCAILQIADHLFQIGWRLGLLFLHGNDGSVLSSSASRGAFSEARKSQPSHLPADSNLTYVSFAFREQPAFFAFDDASVVDLTNPSGNLLNDGGFTNAQVGQTIPTSWGRWIQPIDQSFIGLVSNGPGSNCAPNQGGPLSGGNFWCDGSVQGYDGLWQHISTHPGDTYQISFYLGDNSGQVPSDPTIDMFAYAGDSLPAGTENLPQPSSLALFGSGVLGLGCLLRRKRSP